MEEEVEFSMSGYTQNITMSQGTTSDIIKTIQNYNETFDTDVLNRAICIYSRLNRIFNYKSIKKDKKKQLIFYCIFNAFYELNSAVDPCFLAEKLGMKKNEVDRALNTYNNEGTIIYLPERFVGFYINNFNRILEKHNIGHMNIKIAMEGTISVIEECRNKSDNYQLFNNNARVIAIASLYFYLAAISGWDMNQYNKLYEEACYLTWNCIKKYYLEVSNIYNS